MGNRTTAQTIKCAFYFSSQFYGEVEADVLLEKVAWFPMPCYGHKVHTFWYAIEALK